MHKRLNLGSFLEKTPDGKNYTPEARLYQDILDFCVKQDQESQQHFKHTKIARWLLGNNQEFLDNYTGMRAHTTISSRILNTQERVKNRLIDLSKMHLIRISETPQEKGSGITMLGTLIDGIKAIDEKSKKSLDKRLHETICSISKFA